jgi:hypothetical protein
MPYHLEKGATLRLLELHVNKPRSDMRAMLDVLRASVGKPDWLADAVPTLWQDPRFNNPQSVNGATARDDIIEKWLGYKRKRNGGWQKIGGPTTGYWIAYHGDVSEIMRKALAWALELSLGLPPDGKGPGRDRPWPIELFWKCPAPWFESWVVTRPVNAKGSAHRGLISVVFMTPSHRLSNVAESPLADNPTSTVPGATHPVPSWQDDYEQLGAAFPDPNMARPRVAAQDRKWATWVVTHENHKTVGSVDVTTDTTTFADFAEWGIPQLSIYKGVGKTVIVSPSMAAGGVKEDGTV